MQATVVPGVRYWSRWQVDRAMDFNAWFVEGDGGTLVVDPLDADEGVFDRCAQHGVSAVVITNRDHERAARQFAERFAAPVYAAMPDAGEMNVRVDRTLTDGDDLFGWRVVLFEGFKTAGEFALVHRAKRAAITGDAFWGAPAGALRFMPDDKLADPARAALSARRLLRYDLAHLLVGDGFPIFGNADAALRAMLAARTGVLVNRINLDDLSYGRDAADPKPYTAAAAEIGRLIGAERLGYAAGRLAPGDVYCPNHWHTREEEAFVVWSGTPTLQTPAGTFGLRAGDVIAFPTGAVGAHKLSNDGPGDAVVLMFANIDAGDACYYPDSKKVLVESTGTLVRAEPQLDYFDGEVP